MSEITLPEGSQRSLLLVDDEINILSALKRLLRQDKYEIVTANSGQEALTLLTSRSVDVIVSDQRMPGMTGVEFLRLAKESYPDTIRIVLSGYTELQSVTDAVNEGAVYKFLTKPWDDIQLRGHIAEAFRRKEMADENIHLQRQLQLANLALEATNRELDKLLKEKEERIETDEVSLQITHEILEHVSTPILGIDDEKTIVFVNVAAQKLLESACKLPTRFWSMSAPRFLALMMKKPSSSSTLQRKNCSARHIACSARSWHATRHNWSKLGIRPVHKSTLTTNDIPC